MQLREKTLAVLAICAISCAAQSAKELNAAENLRSGAAAPAVSSAPSAGSGNAATPKTAASSTADDEPYVIGSLDVLDVRVWNDAKMSGVFTVGPDGIISMPLIGDFKADGLTVAELRNVLKEKLTAVMNDPEVNIQVARYNSKKFYIYGGVNRAGEFPLIGKTTLLDAFANCGGFQPFADKKHIRILRGTQEFKFNYNDAVKGKNPEQNIVIKNGDRIFVKGD